MKHFLRVAAYFFATVSFAQTPDVLKMVDPMIGTGPEGHTFPGAAAPFGMVQLSPDTQIRPFKQSYKWAAGYRYEDTSILGFSHTHFSGAGHSDLGDVLLMPVSGDNVPLEPGDPEKTHPGYRSRFSHAEEVAEPGYYSVVLQDSKVRAELTATERVGVHRYTFADHARRHVLLDLRSSIYNYPGKVLWSRIRIRGDGAVTGMRETRGGHPVASCISRSDSPFPFLDTRSTTKKKTRRPTTDSKPPAPRLKTRKALKDAASKLFLTSLLLPTLIVKVALSPVSEQNALANMDAEVPAFDFDARAPKPSKLWREELSRIEFDAPPAMQKSLYTALYHAMMAPGTSMDTNGEYRGPDNQVHRADGFHFVSTLSLWDTYRAEQPLMTLLEPPQRTNDLVRSLIASQQESPFGILPIWQFQGQETWCMIGYHAVPIIADAYMKGIRGYDARRPPSTRWWRARPMRPMATSAPT